MFLSSYLFYILIVKDEHPGEVPYECPRYGCEKMFTRKQKQQDHITLHRVRVRCLMFPRYNNNGTNARKLFQSPKLKTGYFYENQF